MTTAFNPDPPFGAVRNPFDAISRVMETMTSPDAKPGPSTEGASPFGQEGTKRALLGGAQWRFEFPNGYGASVVRHRHSYGGEVGLWELGVTKGDSLTYETPITDDVIGRLDESEVAELLDAIAALR